MEMKFNRALFGYRPKDVAARVKEIQNEKMNEIDELKKELSLRKEETDEIRHRIQSFQSKIQYLENMEADMGRALFKAHMEAVLCVSRANRTAEETRIRLQQMSTNYESEYIRLKKTVKSLLGEIHLKVEEYKQKLGESTNDKSAGENAG